MLRTLIGSRLPPRYSRFFDLPDRPASVAVRPHAATALTRATRRYIDRDSHRHAVYRLDQGLAALAIRLGLIREARAGIDIQSYLLKDDVAGNLIALALLDAAERGVRVRLLMDDALTEEVDSGLIMMNRHRNIEVRVFNPFPRRRSRWVSLAANFNVLNRRMHNKSFTVDGCVTIVGGRNIADEYYQAGGRFEFVDEDLLAIGDVVDDVVNEFDNYWNTREAIPVTVFDDADSAVDVDLLRAEGQAVLDANRQHPLLQSLDSPITRRLLDGELPLTSADVTLVVDPPGKIRPLPLRHVSETTMHLHRMASAAVRELVIVSPYFVPQKEGVDYLAAVVRRGVRVIVVTNSLASTNHASVHAAYARYRKPLLRQGVELYELTPGPGRFGNNPTVASDTTLTLHSKIAVVDRKACFIGSFNMDPRSLYLNTEMGLAVSSEAFSSELAVALLELLPDYTYRLRLGAGERTEWHFDNGHSTIIYNKEPDTTFWRRLRTRLMGFLPIEEQM